MLDDNDTSYVLVEQDLGNLVSGWEYLLRNPCTRPFRRSRHLGAKKAQCKSNGSLPYSQQGQPLYARLAVGAGDLEKDKLDGLNETAETAETGQDGSR